MADDAANECWKGTKGRPGALPPPPRRRILAVSKYAIGLALLNLLIQVLAVVLLAVRSAFGTALVLDGIFITGFLATGSVCLGLHVVYKRIWPGNDASERARRPRAPDLALALAGLSITLLNVLLAGALLWVVTSGPRG